MEPIPNPENRATTSNAPPTIILDRRDRRGWFARLFGPLLLLLVLILIFKGPLGTEGSIPQRLSEEYVAGGITGAKIAVVEISGLILDGEVDYAIRQVRQARDDTSVRAVVLRIDSPGGTVSGSDRIWREVQLLKERGKPVVVSMGGLAASGGYYVAAAADYILAEPTTMTGSIGVILEIPVIRGLLDKVGVEFQTIKTGKWKDSPSLFHPLTDEERERWDGIIDIAYQRFVRVVAQGRSLPLDHVLPVADGRVLTADEALDAKLINEIGYLDDAILHAQRLAGVSSIHVVRYAKPKSVVETLFGAQSSAPGLSIDSDLLLKLQAPKMLYLAR